MAVTNTLQKKTQQKDAQMVKFQANGMTVELTPQIVRDYLVSGDKERVTMQEVVMFINLCKFNGLNPWLKEAYCVKYGSEPATMVTGKQAFEKRAESNSQYNGNKAGIIVMDEETGNIEYRAGAFFVTGEKIVGGWAEVFRKDRTESTRVEVSFEEYAGRKKDGTLNRQWAAKPATMIRKVALVQALREAFPNTFSNMYSAEEQNLDESSIDLTPSTPPEIVTDGATGEVIEQADPAAGFFGDK